MEQCTRPTEQQGQVQFKSKIPKVKRRKNKSGCGGGSSSHNTAVDHSIGSMAAKDGKNFKKRIKRKFSTIQQTVKDESVLELFCRCMSIRGVAKFTSCSLFLRSLWSCFLCLMTLILMGATCLLVMDYFKYDVTLHQRHLPQTQSPFPAITICHHHPFGKSAYSLWDSRTVLSPSRFNLYMRNNALHYLQLKDNFSLNFFYFDSINIYYQSLAYNESIAVGHEPSIILNCLKRTEIRIDFEHDCTNLIGYRVRRFSHLQHFNCYTFEPADQQVAGSNNFFSLIVSLGRAEPDYARHEQAFLIDVFEQARGLRVVVHEPGTLPDVEQEGLHVEPGKLNEINFQPVDNIQLDTPRRPCLSPNTTYQFRDLDQVYNYSMAKCIQMEQQLAIMRECHCMFILYPRPQLPTNELPYCGRLWPHLDKVKFSARLTCLNKHLILDATQQMMTMCLPLCRYFSYEATVSITKWRAKQWQLHWLRLQNEAQKMMYELGANDPDTARRGEAIWRSYLERKNLSDLNLADSRKALNLEGDDFAYVVLKRKGPMLIEKREKEVLSLTVLLSRIGGFCSLLIGLTVAAIVEFIEFIYLLIQRHSVRQKRRSANQDSIKNNFTEFEAFNKKSRPPIYQWRHQHPQKVPESHSLEQQEILL